MADQQQQQQQQSNNQRIDEVVSVFIPRIRRKQSHVEYVVEITGRSAVWNIYRRYQQFRDVHASLARLCSITDAYHTPKGVLPVLPGTSWIRVTSDDVDLVEKRRLHLEIYLQQLLVPSNKFYRDCTELRQFLHQDEMPLTYKNALTRTVPGINAPLDQDPAGSVERVFDEDVDEDYRHVAVIASRPSTAMENAVDPTIPKMDDWSTPGRGHNDLMAVGGHAVANHQQQQAILESRAQNSSTKASEQHGADGVAGGDSTMPHELCKECGHREDIDYDVEEWVPHGHCRHCDQVTEHELVVPTASTASSPAGSGAASGGGGAGAAESGVSPGGASSFATPEEAQAHARRLAQAAGVPIDTLDAPGASADGGGRSPSTGSNSSPTASATGGNETRGSGEANSSQQQQQSAPAGAMSADALPSAQSFDARCDISLSDFELITTLGRGTFGKVMKARYRPDGRVYAIKVLSKSMVHQKRMVDYVKEEKGIMALLSPHPFVVALKFAFQTDHHLYFVMDFLPGGELYAHMQPLERLPLHAARFYAAELLLAIEHIHKHDVCHRDLKPENIVLSADGHIKLTDFGLARRAFSHKRRFSFVGSAEYLSPEVVRTEGQTKAIDWWGYGCMVYELLTGKTPFHAHTAREVYASILNRTVDFNRAGMTAEAQDLIAKLLEKSPRARLQNPDRIKRHPFFAGINWEHVVQKKLRPPFVPDLTSNDTKYFNKEFTSEWAAIPAAANSTRGSVERLAQRFSNFRRIGDHHHHHRDPAAAGNAHSTAGGGAAAGPASASGNAAASNDASNAAASGGGGQQQQQQQRLSPPQNVDGTTPTSDADASPPAADGSPPSTAAGSTRQSMDARASRAATIGVIHGRPLPPIEVIHPLVVLPDRDGSVPRPLSCNDIHLKHIDPDEFVGVWRLLRVEMVSTQGQIVFPWGAEVAGQLIFTKNGLFSMQICPIRRVKFRGVSKPTRDEMCEAFQSYVASFGNFFVVPGKPFIVQRATAALSPSLIGVLQKRYFDLDSERGMLKVMSPLYRGEGSVLVFSAMTWSKVA